MACEITLSLQRAAAAEAADLDVPPTLSARAEEVIE
jgi:hypothetical protein